MYMNARVVSCVRVSSACLYVICFPRVLYLLNREQQQHARTLHQTHLHTHKTNYSVHTLLPSHNLPVSVYPCAARIFVAKMCTRSAA